MALKFYNTLTRKKEAFKPVNQEAVRIYNCGPTVYNFAHIGNFRAYVCSDILKRYLIYKGYKVKQAMNITDVDDKTIRDSQKENMPLRQFTDKYAKAFFEDLETLNISKADVFPRATGYINEMVKLVEKLLEKGIAYKTKDGIYYDISKFKNYGKLSGVKIDMEKKGARVNVDEYDKENAKDFALWKFWDKKDGDVFWETHIGKGRPGWHIECSAMSMKTLGESFDIHTGGIDLIFPHHENEIAQSEAATGKKYVKYWLHNEYMLVDGKKMSKSLGNFYTLRDLLAKGHKPAAIRYLLLSSHYRQQLNFTLDGLDAAQKSVDRINEFVGNVSSVKDGKENKEASELTAKAKKDFENAMDDDLNISEALAAVFELIKEVNKLNMENNIGKKNNKEIIEFMKNIDSVLAVIHEKEAVPKGIIMLAEEREKARKEKDFKKADKIREELKNKGYSIEDCKDVYRIKKIE